ncbi:cytochrome P450 71A6-like [Cynara cardunculus var. scolymus]|uniref:cytochrome P450 71A6-like n=1 Tax=Cynara cardunculus var. scolymus TaxID=59895 RepID=UPI000D62B318|nr:cytochrome P450 71A6-like [Cynara cardunculus var. scolymus]
MFHTSESDLFFYLCIPLSILLVFLILFKWLSSVPESHKNRPPSPLKLPVIGNLHQLGSSPHSYLHDLAKKHGPLMLIHLGSVPVVVASTPETAQEILKTHDLEFCYRPKSSISHALSFGSKDIAFSPYGEYWRQIKSISMLQLLSTQRVRSFRQVREEETRVMIDMITKSHGSLVDFKELLTSLTSNVVCRVTLGKTYQGLKFKHLLTRVTYLLGVFSAGSYIPWLSWVGRLWGLERAAIELAPEVDAFLEGVLEEHINKRSRADVDDETDKPQDFLDILLDPIISLHRDTVKAIILNVFAAGIESTAASIEWALSELLRHPQAMRKLQLEVSEVAQGRSTISEEDVEKMPYLKAVIKEALRLHPPAPLLITREAIKDVKLMGYDIAAGTQVLVNAFAIARDPSLWDEPDKFKPERFLSNAIDYKRHHFEYLPFGAGRRMCPGTQFSIAIDQIVIANLVYKFDLALPDDEELDMSENMGLVVHKMAPLMAMAIPHF